MFAKNNKFLYYMAIALCIYAAFELYSERKRSFVKTQREVKNEVDMPDFNSFFTQISDAIKSPPVSLSSVAQEPPTPNFRTTFLSLQNKEDRIGLCANTYSLNLWLFNENGDEIYSKKGLKLNEIGGELYEELNRALTLTAAQDRFEIFVKNLGILPAFMISNPDDASKSGIFTVEVVSVIGSVNFSAKGVKTFNTIYPKNTINVRAKSKFFCKEEVRVSYSVYNTNGEIVKEETVGLNLGKTASKKEQILEYLVLNSKDGDLDAIVPSNPFSANYKEKSLIMKGKIFKSND
jgi:hypothetical protein